MNTAPSSHPTYQWRKSMGRWILGPEINPIAEVTVYKRGDAGYVVFPFSPEPIRKRGIATSGKARDEADAIIEAWSEGP